MQHLSARSCAQSFPNSLLVDSVHEATQSLGSWGWIVYLMCRYHYYGINARPNVGHLQLSLPMPSSSSFFEPIEQIPTSKSSHFTTSPTTSSSSKQRHRHSANHRNRPAIKSHTPTKSDERGECDMAAIDQVVMEQLVHLPMPDFSRYPIGLNIDHIRDFFHLYRDHCGVVLKEGLKGSFDVV